jgi:hypothetical protein
VENTECLGAERRIASEPGRRGHLDSVERMAATAPSESTPQRIAVIREQLKLLGDYL